MQSALFWDTWQYFQACLKQLYMTTFCFHLIKLLKLDLGVAYCLKGMLMLHKHIHLFISIYKNLKMQLNPPMVKPFRLTYLAKGGEKEKGPPPLEILTIACLTFCLLLTDRPTLGLPEYKLKVVNVCKMHGTGGLEVVEL